MKLSSLIIVILVVGLVAGAFLRPAIVLGTDTDSVSASLERQLPDSSPGAGGGEKIAPQCTQTADRAYTCRTGYNDGSNQTALDYDVSLRRFGCWDAAPRQAGRGDPVSGCIWIIDY